MMDNSGGVKPECECLRILAECDDDFRWQVCDVIAYAE